MRHRGAAIWLGLVCGLGLASASPAQTDSGAQGRGTLVREMMNVTGTLRLVPEPAGQGSGLEIDAGALGRFRILELGVGTELKSHVDEQVTVVAFVEPFEEEGHPVLRVTDYLLHDRQT